MDLFWNKKISSNPKTDDPLGFLRKIKIKIFDTLFLGLTKPVYNAKYYSLYPSFIYFLEKHNLMSKEDSKENLAKLDKAFLVAAKEVTSEEDEKKTLGLLGIGSINKLSEEDLYSLNFDMFSGGGIGFDKLYGNLLKMGLLKDSNEGGITLKTKTTIIGRSFAKFSCLEKFDSLEDTKKLIESFKEDVYLKDDEKEFLRKLFLGRYKFNKGDVVFDEGVDYSFDYNDLLSGKLSEEYVNNLFIKIRNNTIRYWLSIFSKYEKLDNNTFLQKLLVDTLYNQDSNFKKIREFWKFYFAFCGYEEVGNLTMYYFYELLRKRWDGTPDKEVSMTFEELKKLNSKEFEYNLDGFDKVVLDINSNLDRIEELPVRIKKLYGETIELFDKLDPKLVDFLLRIEENKLHTRYNLDMFIGFYRDNNNVSPYEFVYKFFMEFCLPRQDDIIKDRGYTGKDERILFVKDESGISSVFPGDFKPIGVLDHSKMENALRILSDIGLISGGCLTEIGRKLVGEQDDK